MNQLPARSDIFATTLPRDLCVGCGVCAGVCPWSHITMVCNAAGEYKPVRPGPCEYSCGLCGMVYPFSDLGEDEDELARREFSSVPGVKYEREIGFYLECFVGAVTDTPLRLRAASGGITTWLLCNLLSERLVDQVVTVRPTGCPDGLFEFAVFRHCEELLESAGSVYYPVEMSALVREMNASTESYAVVALPCYHKALRRARARLPGLDRAIRFQIGLTCGQMKSKYYTDYLAHLAGADITRTNRVRFREKRGTVTANDYVATFAYPDDSPNDERRVLWSEGVSTVWNMGYFTLNACFYCDDVFAETGDVTLMDAWLPEYTRDPRGHSMLVVRDASLLQLIEKGVAEGSLSLDRVAPERVVESQSGAVARKQRGLAVRLKLWPRHLGAPPLKRVAPANRVGLLHGIHEGAVMEIARRSKRAFAAGGSQGVASVRKALRTPMAELAFVRWARRAVATAKRFICRGLR